MSDLKRASGLDEVDGLDESAEGVPAPHTASEFVADYVLPAVVPRHTSFVAVLALALSFVIPVGGIVLGHRVIRKLQHDGGRGRSVAQAAVVIGYLNVLLLALIAVNVVAAMAFGHAA